MHTCNTSMYNTQCNHWAIWGSSVMLSQALGAGALMLYLEVMLSTIPGQAKHVGSLWWHFVINTAKAVFTPAQAPPLILKLGYPSPVIFITFKMWKDGMHQSSFEQSQKLIFGLFFSHPAAVCLVVSKLSWHVLVTSFVYVAVVQCHRICHFACVFIN